MSLLWKTHEKYQTQGGSWNTFATLIKSSFFGVKKNRNLRKQNSFEETFNKVFIIWVPVVALMEFDAKCIAGLMSLQSPKKAKKVNLNFVYIFGIF